MPIFIKEAVTAKQKQTVLHDSFVDKNIEKLR
jgi:hypothetical protein